MKKCFLFSCIWAVGGTLNKQSQSVFNLLWRQHFHEICCFPPEGEIWDYYFDSETRHFVKWSDAVPIYSAPAGFGISPQAFVHTVDQEQLLYVTSLLSTAGHHVMLIGEAGCGKTAILREQLQALTSADMTDVQQLQIPMSRITNPKMLWESLLNKLEWHHGTVYSPAKNKRLLCLVDDLHLAEVDVHGSQPSCEMMRQLLDCRGGFDLTSLEWKSIRNVSFLASTNADCTTAVPGLTRRLLRHFSLFHCPYPSLDNQHSIFTSLLNGHFLSSSTLKDSSLPSLLSAITLATIETQERLRTMFLETSERCHYIFTLRDLVKVFRYLCLSLGPETSSEQLLCLWKHECEWVYGHRMVNQVDYSRYKQEYTAAVKKVFQDEEQISVITSSDQLLFSNVIECEGGLMIAAPMQWHQHKLPDGKAPPDGYQPSSEEGQLRAQLQEALREYNKTNPRMTISFYRSTIELVCRLTRILSGPHYVGHTLLCGEGCAGICMPLVRLAAHLSSSRVIQVNSHARAAQPQAFIKSQLADACVTAGVQGQRVVLVLMEDHLLNSVMDYVAQLTISGSMAHLFTQEQQASIMNKVRSEITKEGMHFTKEDAWEYFSQKVTQNLRCVIIAFSAGGLFHHWCRELPAFTNTINIYYVPHWSRSTLVSHAFHQVHSLDMLSNKQKENVSYLLASMHLSINKNDGGHKGAGSFGHLTNCTFEKFVLAFIALLRQKYVDLMLQHGRIDCTLEHINNILETSEKLQKDLDHEKVVLEERKLGTQQILSQMGQDKAMVEQQIRMITRQRKKIKKLQSLLPELHLAHERSVYKCSAIVSNIKKNVGEIDIESLGELRAMQKPDADIEDLMASIITVLKSPTADLSWSKGAKRQMANLDRFLEELSSFDKIQLPETTLTALETQLQKECYTAENMEHKAGGNSAAGSLLRWLQNAVSYHRLTMSRVGPLAKKVSEMTVALEQALQKMKTLQSKKKALLSRLEDLEKGFEGASIDKNDQQTATIEIEKRLESVSSVTEILHFEKNKYAETSVSCMDRILGLMGSAALAAGLLIYLGPYDYLFRRLMLSVEWPQCLKERGLPLLFDSVDPIQGRIIDFSIEFFKGDDGKAEKETDVTTDSSKSLIEQSQQESNQAVESGDPDPDDGESSELSSLSQDPPIPLITEEQYEDYSNNLLKVLVGRQQVQKWLAKDWTLHQMQNAAILFSSWQMPPLLIDPSDEADKWFMELKRTLGDASDISLRLSGGPDADTILSIEKAMQSGCCLFLSSYTKPWEDVIQPLIEHCNQVTEEERQQGSSSVVTLEGRRVMCSSHFKLYLSVAQTQEQISPDVSCQTILLNYTEVEETLKDVLLHRIFAALHPTQYEEFKKVSKTILRDQNALEELEHKFSECFESSPLNTEKLASIYRKQRLLSDRLQKVASQREKLAELRNSLLPVAQRGALLYSILQALRSLAREYYFTLKDFLQMFDAAGAVCRQEKVEEGKSFSLSSSGDESDEPFETEPSDKKSPDQVQNDDLPTTETPRPLEPSAGGNVAPQQAAHSDLQKEDENLSLIQSMQLLDHLTKTVYHGINKSLRPEHSFIFSCMLILYMQLERGDILTEEELSCLLQGFSHSGVSLTLKDFGCDAALPAWLSVEQWQSLAALSLLPGRLEGLCVKVAEHSTEWEMWFASERPEISKMDLKKDKAVKDDPQGSDDLASEIHHLLILRALRPDRFAVALSLYIRKHGYSTLQAGSYWEIGDIQRLAENSLGILVLLPAGVSHANGCSDIPLTVSLQPTSVICKAAMDKAIPVSVIALREGCESFIESSLEEMLKKDGWLVIENLHLASQNFLEILHHKLISLQSTPGAEGQRQFCVWLTSEPGAALPEQLIAGLHKVSWHILSFGHLLRRPELSNLVDESGSGALLPLSLVSALSQVEHETWMKVHQLPALTHTLCFAVCIYHGIIGALPFLPVPGLSLVYAMSPLLLQQAFDILLGGGNFQKGAEEAYVHSVIENISLVYAQHIMEPEDTKYIRALAEEIFLQCMESQGEIRVGDTVIPLPPVNMDPVQYPLWLIEKLPQMTMNLGTSLHHGNEQACSHMSTENLLHSLSAVYEALQCDLPSTDRGAEGNPSREFVLRSSLDLLSEHLPPLLELPNFTATIEGTEDNGRLAAVTHAMLQECKWMNRSLQDIRLQLTRLSTALCGGLQALPGHLSEVTEALLRGQVPESWLHPNCQPDTSSLQSWIEDLKRSRNQLEEWTNEIVLTDKKWRSPRAPLWLGGLVNPSALILSMRQDFAAANGHLLDEVSLKCVISEHFKHEMQSPSAQHQVTLTDLVLHGASWDFETSCLGEARNENTPLPYVTVKPFLKTTGTLEGRDQFFECPVYMNKTWQCCVLKLPLPSLKSAQHWQLRRTAILLSSRSDSCLTQRSRTGKRTSPSGSLPASHLTEPHKENTFSRLILAEPAVKGSGVISDHPASQWTSPDHLSSDMWSPKVADQNNTELPQSIQEDCKVNEDLTTTMPDLNATENYKVNEDLTATMPDLNATENYKVNEDLTATMPDLNATENYKVNEDLTATMPDLNATENYKVNEDLTTRRPDRNTSEVVSTENKVRLEEEVEEGETNMAKHGSVAGENEDFTFGSEELAENRMYEEEGHYQGDKQETDEDTGNEWDAAQESIMLPDAQESNIQDPEEIHEQLDRANYSDDDSDF
ncbi:dynein axonemal heavy chain 9-like isoform X2 [Erpetoichthys calabaricus]|uniref:dynein axonemal heavy chain 9-like isoform X2 n=1 Tax=Erpetoichthys calabaricus TaxID=27687 RepID=UPI002234DBA1|nr:dynein axonemal heavy chain 9-like isoform X2 [Erpetoichthys calabaricus]